MSYGTKYRFNFESSNGATVRIDVNKDGYTGSINSRALGRSPVLKKQKSGGICGTSLDFYAECKVNGELAEFYTSNPKEYEVVLYRAGSEMWRGFISPELYSEPDVAPPYDVNVTATDGIGELKLYDYEDQGNVTIRQQLTYLLGFTGGTTAVNFVSALASVAPAVSASHFLDYVKIDLGYMAGETCYDTLQYLLDTLHATITRHAGSWLLARETDVYISSSKVQYITTSGTTAYFANSVKSVGKMGVADLWPVGNTTTKIEPAKNKIIVTSPWNIWTAIVNPEMRNLASHPNGTPWTASRTAASWSSTREGWVFYTGASSLSRTDRLVEQNVSISGLSFSSAFRFGAVQDAGVNCLLYLNLTFTPTSGGTTYDLLKDEDDNLVWVEGSNASAYSRLDFSIESYGTSRSEAEEKEITVPPLLVNGVAVSGSLNIRFISKDNITLFWAFLEPNLGKGYRDIVKISNGARGEGDETEVAGGYVTSALENCLAFLRGVFNYGGQFVTSLSARNTTARNYLSFISLDYALSVALSRLKSSGTLNIPATLTDLPLVIISGNVNHWIDTYSWSLAEDELEYEALSLPAASLTVQSETIEGLGNSSSGSSSSGGGGGTGGVTIADVADYCTSQGFISGITSSMVTTALGYTPLSSSALNGYATQSWVTQQFSASLLKIAPKLFRRRGYFKYGSSVTFVDQLNVSHPLLGTSDYEVVLMVYAKRNAKKTGTYTSGGVTYGRYLTKKYWAVARGNHDATDHTAFTTTYSTFDVTTMLTFIIKRFIQVEGQTASWVYTNMNLTQFVLSGATYNKHFAKYKNYKRFGIAVRYKNPAFTALVTPGTTPDETTQDIDGVPRYIYSNVTPLDIHLQRNDSSTLYVNRIRIGLLGVP